MIANNRPTTRIEAFTDAAFAFALTMLVISFDQLPSSVDELLLSMRSIPAFLGSGALLMMFWHQHSQWSQLYNLADGKTVLLTCALVFTVMVFVYPLRLMMSGFMHWVSAGWLRASFTATSANDLIALFVIYAIGFSIMCLIMVQLYRHALTKAVELNFNERDKFDAESGRNAFLLLGTSGVLSIVLCAVLPLKWALFSPFTYSMLAIVMPLYGRHRNKMRQNLKSAAG